MDDRVFTAEHFDDQWRIRFSPPVKDNGDGTKSFGLSFPLLHVTDWPADPDVVARAVADVLEENRARFLGQEEPNDR